LDTPRNAAWEDFFSHQNSAVETRTYSVKKKRRVEKSNQFGIWTTFCHRLGVSPDLKDVPAPDAKPPGAQYDQLDFIEVFLIKFHNGSIAPSGNPVTVKHAKEAAAGVGQTLARMGTPDPRLVAPNVFHPRYKDLTKGMASKEPATPKKGYIPKEVLQRAATLDPTKRYTAQTHATADLIWIGMFFLLRPGEYLKTNCYPEDAHPFELQDVTFRVFGRSYNAAYMSLDLFDHVTFASLRFTTQKNGIENEDLGQATTGDVFACPVKRLVSRVQHLRAHSADPTTPLYQYTDSAGTHNISDSYLTHQLRKAAESLFDFHKYTIGMLRNTGAQALCNAGTQPDIQQLLGRWHSDARARYLTANSEEQMQHHASNMLQHAP